MIASIVSSLIYSKRRTVIEVISPRLRKLWKEWDLRVMVLLSLFFQIVLIILGNRRKYSHRLWIRFVLWSAYLSADMVATAALGALSNNLADIYEDNDGCILDVKVELTAFWAPFLLLHLGGPDTITAYALEDNELWLRHFLQLVVQTGITVYVFLMAWTGSRLSIMFILMFFAGLIKYGERTWALWSATNETLRQKLERRGSFGTYADLTLDQFDREQRDQIEVGYVVGVDLTNKLHRSEGDLAFYLDNSASEEDKLHAAYAFQDVTLSIFLESPLTFSLRHQTHSIFRNMSSENAFKVTELELGLIYDLLYTKGPLLCKPWSLALRLITFILTCFVFVFFAFLEPKREYSKVDISITFLLLVIGIILEIYSAFLLLSSDHFVARNLRNSAIKVPTCFSPSKSPRWSNKMPQYSLLSYSLQEKPLPCQKILYRLRILHNLEKGRYVIYKEVPEDFKRLVFRYFKKRAAEATSTGNTGSKNKFSFNVFSNTREAEDCEGLVFEAPKFEEDLNKSILFWHILTELCYYLDRDQEDTKQQFEDIVTECKLIRNISKYMLYLTVMNPSMISVGITQISFEEFAGMVDSRDSDRLPTDARSTTNKTEACRKVVDSGNWVTQNDDVLKGAIRAYKRMNDAEKDMKKKWNKLGCTWLEILAYAARKCKGREHAQQLRRGGELLTHIWLLMAHFGLTDHFQIPEDPAIGRLIAK